MWQRCARRAVGPRGSWLTVRSRAARTKIISTCSVTIAALAAVPPDSSAARIMRRFLRAPARRPHRLLGGAPVALRALALTGLAGLAGLASAYPGRAGRVSEERPPPLYLGLDSYLHL